MLTIVLIGLNHKTASVELRECLAFSKEEKSSALQSLPQHSSINEVVLVSTCNRVEILMTSNNPEEALKDAKSFFCRFKNLPLSQFEDSLYFHVGDEAVRHFFKVASSLDSMMVGEPQILGQIKEAYRTATDKKTTSVILNRLLHRTFSVAKRVRTETGIGDHAVSISYAAIELGRKIFGNLENKEVLLVGAGEMAELAVEHLLRNRVGCVFVSNRTFERAVKLAGRFNGKALRFDEIPSYLEKVDIVISSTGASGFIIHHQQIKKIMRPRRNRPVFFIDIAVPRDIDPEINRLNNAYVYDIDDLKEIVDENIDDRNMEALKGERIVDEAVIGFRRWYENLEVVPTIVALKNKMEAIARNELNKTASLRNFSNADCMALEKMTNAMVNKILHDPIHLLKNESNHIDNAVYLDMTRRLFNLNE
ncbi:MAG: glutamyl-tRNA reductase [Desulfobacteraceae bacterium 4572_123]|nr:MAG: glutamyl-tRNA reductase [Desulfobacteraceae bacterium 4572_123]